MYLRIINIRSIIPKKRTICTILFVDVRCLSSPISQLTTVFLQGLLKIFDNLDVFAEERRKGIYCSCIGTSSTVENPALMEEEIVVKGE